MPSLENIIEVQSQTIETIKLSKNKSTSTTGINYLISQNVTIY